MKESEVIELLNRRDEKAIVEMDLMFRKYLLSIIYKFLPLSEDQEEVLNDTYLAAWNSIPPNAPKSLKLYLAKIAKNKSINAVNRENRSKRIDKNLLVILDEIDSLSDDKVQPENAILQKELSQRINSFLRELPEIERFIFLRRYWYYENVSEIAERYGLSYANVKTKLFRLRKKLIEYLKEGEYEV